MLKPRGWYEVKHEQLIGQKNELESRLGGLGEAQGGLLKHRLAVLELAQKAGEIYQNRSPEQKRLIMSKLFASMTIKSGLLSVKYTNLVKIIADKVTETYQIMEVAK